MTYALEVTLFGLILTTLAVLGSVRSQVGMQALAAQGFVVGLVPLFLFAEEGAWGLARSLFLAAVSITIKGVVFPWLLGRALRETPMREEETPLIGPSLSLVLGVGMLGLAFWLTRPELLTPPQPLPRLVMPVALFTLLAGLFVICTRNRALSQVLGYLLLENGVYVIGLAIARESPLLIEMGALLDVLFAVLVMGVAIFHIGRAFDSIEVDQMVTLKD
jgi:hydrogenase-4 component E